MGSGPPQEISQWNILHYTLLKDVFIIAQIIKEIHQFNSSWKFYFFSDKLIKWIDIFYVSGVVLTLLLIAVLGHVHSMDWLRTIPGL